MAQFAVIGLGAFGKKEGGLVGLAGGGKIGKYSAAGRIGGQSQGPGSIGGPGIFGNAQQYQIPSIPAIGQDPQITLDAYTRAKNLQMERTREALQEKERLRQQQNPFLVPTQTQESKDYLTALKNIDFAKRKTDVEEAYDKEEGDIKRDKYLALAKAGLGILSANPAGKTPFQAIASGFLDYKALDDLKDSYKDERKLLRERTKDLQGIEDKKLANMAGVANLTQAQADAVRQAEIAKLTNQMAKLDEKQKLAAEVGKAADKVTQASLKASEIQADKLGEVITLTFNKRGDQVPDSFCSFPSEWKLRYNRLAKEIELDIVEYQEAVKAVTSFISPVLSCSVAGLTWNSIDWKWDG